MAVTNDWLGRIGLLPFVVGVATVGAAAVHLGAFPDAAYTWSRSPRLLWGVVTSGSFPLFALGAFALGFFTRLDRAGLALTEEHLRGLFSRGARTRLAWTLTAVVSVVLIAWVVFPAFEAADLLAIAFFATYLGLRRPDPQDWGRFVVELVLVVFLFTFVSYAFTVIKALLFRVGTPHDAAIQQFEHWIVGASPHRLVASLGQLHPWLVALSDRVYYLLFHHMFFVSIFLVGAARREERIEYMASLAFCYVLGAVTYYVFPAYGPAFADPEAFRAFRDWPMLTNQFQPLLQANTAAAAQGRVAQLQTYEYISAMPSLHMAHELVMLWYARRSGGFFVLSLGFSLLTVVAIVMLGWHYPTDVLAGAALAATAV